jgi:hypothetical protein
MSQARAITPEEATIVHQAAAFAAKDRELAQAIKAVQELQQHNSALRALVPNQALSSEAAMAAWKTKVAAMNDEFTKANDGQPAPDAPSADAPAAANDEQPPMPPAPGPKSNVTTIKKRR